ncbi:MAG: RNA polymerase sigma factor [Candidatus Blackburnbacteria bacterium]|nr:RNA polymerase sigma factor [Candidatus Blackburnbacteria bacterium]
MDDEILGLVIRAKRGDKNAFGKLYNLYFKKIYRYVYYSIYGHELSEDITQNTFLKAWKSLPSFTVEKGTFQAYIFMIARNLVTDYQRKRKEISLEVIEDTTFSEEDLAEQISREQNKDMVQNVLSGLNGFEKQIVILRFFEELSFSEIARVIGKKEGALRVQIHRILKKLAERLKDYGN